MFGSKARREKEHGLDSVPQKQLGDPESLAFFYMDSMMCNEYYMKHQDCLKEYESKWFFSMGRKKLHRECTDYLDRYRACLIGINTDKVSLPSSVNR